MREMRVAMAVFCGAALLWSASVVADDHEHSHKLPPGPIHDRHELMEEIGKHAKKIGEAGKAGDKKAIVPEAEGNCRQGQEGGRSVPAGQHASRVARETGDLEGLGQVRG